MATSEQIDLSLYATHWNLSLTPDIQCTAQATLAFGYYAQQPVVLKIMHSGSDEHQSLAVLQHFAGHGAVRCIDTFENALLLERIAPGTPLTQSVQCGQDEQAMQILCGVIRKLHAPTTTTHAGFPTVEQWGKSFYPYLDKQPHPLLPATLVKQAAQLYTALCDTQSREMLLHGDLHHDNILFDNKRGWLAIDPKGVLGEPEYEIGAALRNPTLDTTLYADTCIIERRIAIAARELGFNKKRMADWCFAQAVLSSVWAVEDQESEAAISRGLALARATLPLLSM